MEETQVRFKCSLKKKIPVKTGKFKPQSEGVTDDMGFSGRQAEEHEMRAKQVEGLDLDGGSGPRRTNRGLEECCYLVRMGGPGSILPTHRIVANSRGDVSLGESSTGSRWQLLRLLTST